MRKAKVIAFVLIAILCLFSLRDKELVITVPDIPGRKPLEAKAEPRGDVFPSEDQFGYAPPESGPVARRGFPPGDVLPEEVSYPAKPATFEAPLPFGAPAPPGTSQAPSSAGTEPVASQTPSPEVLYYGLGTIFPQAAQAEEETPQTGPEVQETSPGTTPSTPPQVEPEPPNPVFITKLTPDNGTLGTNVIIQGAGFSETPSENIVKFDTTQSSSVSVISQNQIRARVPQGLSPGFVDLSVSVNGEDSNTALFDVLKDSNGQVFIDETQNLLPAGLVIHEGSILKLGDIDNDKDLDLFVIDTLYGEVYLLVNDGEGSFTDEASARLPSLSNIDAITDLIFGDMDNDSDLDVLFTENEGQSLRLLMNDGSGVFSDETGTNLPSLSNQAQSLDLGDVDGDGDLDIVIANRNAKDKLLINDGSGVFTLDTGFDLPEIIDASSDILFGDVDGDGDLDILTTNNDVLDTSSLRNRIYINDGNGLFTDETETYLPEDSEYTEILDAGDIDLDTDLDIIFANYSQNLVFINNGSGIYSDETTARIPANYFASLDTKLGDIDGDGDLDIVMLGEEALSLFINDGSGYFEEASTKIPDYESTPAPLGGKEIELRDIDGDGDLDIVIGGSLYLLLNDIENKPPVLEPIGNKTVSAGGTLIFNVTASDPNDDPLSYLAENLPGDSTFESQLFNWSPQLADVGAYNNVRFIVREDTPDALEDAETITINVIHNNPPILSVLPQQSEITFSAGDSWIFLASATDPDGDSPITISWEINGNRIGMTIGESSLMSVIFGTGTHLVVVRATDSRGASSSFTWTVHVFGEPGGNRAPVIDATIPATSEVPTVNVEPGDIATQEFRVSEYHDPDGDNISFSWFKKPAGGTYEEIPQLSGQTSGFIALTPGEYYIKVVLTDDGTPRLSTSFEWHLTIVETPQGNRAPVIDATSPPTSEVPTINVEPGGIATQEFRVSEYHDPDGDNISFSWFKKPAGGTYEEIPQLSGQTSGFIALTPGEYYIKVVLTDDGTPRLSTSFEWHVSVVEESQESIIDEIIRTTFPYFWYETDNPSTGFVRDRLAVNPANRNSTFDERYEMASMSSTGFGLASLCVAAERYGDGSDPDWQITPGELAQRAELTIDKLLEIQSNQDPFDETTWEIWGRDGFFYHYVNINDGTRWPNSEVSTIDTAILVAGVLSAGEYFKNVDTDPLGDQNNIREKALQVYRNVNWKAFLDTEPTVPNTHITANPNYNQIYHAWNPDRPLDDRFFGHWDYTDESMILYLLAVATPEADHAVPSETFYSFRRELGKYGQDGKPMVQSWFGSLFVYQYTHAFFNFKDQSGEPLYDLERVDWWENSVEATKANKKFCNDNIENYAQEENLWGLTSAYTSGFAYAVYGAPPAAIDIPSADVHGADGTVMPNAVGGSIPMLPIETIQALNKMKELYDVYGHPIWGDYGFVSSFKLGNTPEEVPFPIADFYTGIDMGITLVMAENYNSGLIFNMFSNFEIEPGVTIRKRIIQNIGFSTDTTSHVNLDNIGPTANFHMGMIDSTNTAYNIQFDLEAVINSPYLLAIHSFMDEALGNHQVFVNISVNGTPVAGNPITFEYSNTLNKSSLMKYIPIDSSLLQVGTNTITLTWQETSASWLAWKNIEISSPVQNDTWIVSRDVEVDPMILFGNEYRLDDTHYVGSDPSSFEQAINKDVQNFSDILFYTENAEYGILTLNVLSTDRDLPTNVQVFINGSLIPLFDGQLSSGQIQETGGFYLNNGWNRITLYHPGVGSGSGEWIRWQSISFVEATAPIPTPPQEFVGASFGKNEVRLRWNEVDGASKYNVYRSDTQGGPYGKIATVNAAETRYFDNNNGLGLNDNTPYYYIVRSADSGDRESPDSQEVKVTTGPYQLDYTDGHDPNVFGGNTLDNNGTPLGDNAYIEMERYNGEIDNVRQSLLNSGQKNTIRLANANIGDATIFSFRVRTDMGGEKFQIKLKDAAGGEASVSLESPVADIWQEMHLYIHNTFPGVNLTNVASLEIIRETSGEQIILYLDEIEFSTVDLGPDRLDIKIRNGYTDGLTSSLDFGTNSIGTTRVLANQYLEIDYFAQTPWGIQIYTDNKANDAYPKFTGTGDRANGLIGMKNSGYRVPIIWQVWQEKKGYYNGSETVEFDTTVDDGDRAEFAFVMDKSDSDWQDGGFVRNYRTLINSNGELGAPVPLAPGGGYWPRVGTVGEPLYVYLGADFTGAPAQTYTTNKLTIDIYHD